MALRPLRPRRPWAGPARGRPAGSAGIAGVRPPRRPGGAGWRPRDQARPPGPGMAGPRGRGEQPAGAGVDAAQAPGGQRAGHHPRARVPVRPARRSRRRDAGRRALATGSVDRARPLPDEPPGPPAAALRTQRRCRGHPEPASPARHGHDRRRRRHRQDPRRPGGGHGCGRQRCGRVPRRGVVGRACRAHGRDARAGHRGTRARHPARPRSAAGRGAMVLRRAANDAARARQLRAPVGRGGFTGGGVARARAAREPARDEPGDAQGARGARLPRGPARGAGCRRRPTRRIAAPSSSSWRARKRPIRTSR